MTEMQEPPDDVTCGANYLESGLGHVCVQSVLLSLLTCFLGLLGKNGWMFDGNLFS